MISVLILAMLIVGEIVAVNPFSSPLGYHQDHRDYYGTTTIEIASFSRRVESFCSLLRTSRRLFSHSRTLMAIPKGRVEDIDEWIQMSSNSLQKITSKSLYDYMEGVDEPSQVHIHERYAVLSHGIQDDPIYCYFNKAALLQFQWTEDEIYQLPSRYSAPDGIARTERQADVQDAINQDLKELSSVIRQTKHGDLFEMVNVLLWNVYNDEGERVGQTALYDRNLVRPYDVAKRNTEKATTAVENETEK